MPTEKFFLISSTCILWLTRILWVVGRIQQCLSLMLLCGLGENTGVTTRQTLTSGERKQHICCGSQCCQADRPYGLYLSTTNLTGVTPLERLGAMFEWTLYVIKLIMSRLSLPPSLPQSARPLFVSLALHAYELACRRARVLNLKITTRTSCSLLSRLCRIGFLADCTLSGHSLVWFSCTFRRRMQMLVFRKQGPE